MLIDGAQTYRTSRLMCSRWGRLLCLLGPQDFWSTGIGAVFVKEELHDVMPPWQGGGNMIRNVTFEETSYSDAPAKFESWHAQHLRMQSDWCSVDYVNRLGLQNIAAYEHELLQYATECMLESYGLRLLGTAGVRKLACCRLCCLTNAPSRGAMLDQEGIAVRAGHHCSQPSLRRFGVESTVRPSLAFYNTHGEIDRLVDAIKRIQLMP